MAATFTESRRPVGPSTAAPDTSGGPTFRSPVSRERVALWGSLPTDAGWLCFALEDMATVCLAGGRCRTVPKPSRPSAQRPRGDHGHRPQAPGTVARSSSPPWLPKRLRHPPHAPRPPENASLDEPQGQSRASSPHQRPSWSTEPGSDPTAKQWQPSSSTSRSSPAANAEHRRPATRTNASAHAARSCRMIPGSGFRGQPQFRSTNLKRTGPPFRESKVLVACQERVWSPVKAARSCTLFRILADVNHVTLSMRRDFGTCDRRQRPFWSADRSFGRRGRPAPTLL